MINWHKYFDHIYCISNIGTNRYNTIKNELNRIGILDSGIFSWKITTNAFLSKITYDLNYLSLKYNDNNIIKNKSIDLVKANLDIFCESKLLRYNKILVIEDDVCFLKDINEIEKILNNLPNNYDICHFDWIFLRYFIDLDIKKFSITTKINNDYSYSLGSYLTSCNAYSNKFINIVLDNIISNYINKGILNPIDDLILFTISDLNIIFSNNDNNYNYFCMCKDNLLNDDLFINIISNKRLCIQNINFNSLNKDLRIDNFYFNTENPLDQYIEPKLDINKYNLYIN